MTLSPQEQRAVGAPELYRARAQAAAGMTMTAAAAITAGVLFGSPESNHGLAGVFGIITIVVLLLALVCFSAGAQYSAAKDSGDPDVDKAQLLVDGIRVRTTIGNWFSCASIVGFALTAGFALFLPSGDDLETVRVVLSPEGISLVSKFCEDLPPDPVVQVGPSSRNGDGDFIELTIPASTCGKSSARVDLPRGEILAIVAFRSQK